jgi:LPS-assembly lipoprotein
MALDRKSSSLYLGALLMLLFNRRKFLVGSFFLTGCGYTPVHGTDSKAKKLYSSVFVQAPKDRVEFELVKNLEKQFGKATSRQYAFNYTLRIKEEKAVVSASQTLERYSLVGSLKYSLITKDGEVVLTSTAKSFAAYSATGTALATEQAKLDAQDRLMVILAEQVLNRIFVLSQL